MEVCKIIKKTEDIEFIGATLISIEEYEKVAGIVPLTEDWWLRSPGNYSCRGNMLDGYAAERDRTGSVGQRCQLLRWW